MVDDLTQLLQSAEEPSESVAAAVRDELARKTKPPGSLGRLEDLAVRYAAIRHEPRPARPRFAVVVVGADHGVAERSVSAYPSEVTGQMIANIAGGGAAISVLARAAGAELVVVDAGSRGDSVAAGVLDIRALHGSGDIASEPAMTVDEARRLIGEGAQIAARLIDSGVTAIALGEMGIGNSTVAAAITAATLGLAQDAVVGRGTGIDDERLAAKRAVVRRALDRARATEPLDVLTQLGGLEIATLVGVTLQASTARTPVLLDGYISTAAALVAARLQPRVAGALIASHRSAEPGHARQLRALGLCPLLDLELRLGEGSGAALAMPLVTAAIDVLRDMATFDSAGVSASG